MANTAPAVLIKVLAARKDDVTAILNPLESNFEVHFAAIAASVKNWRERGSALAGAIASFAAVCNSVGETTALHIVKVLNPVMMAHLSMRVHSFISKAADTIALSATVMPFVFPDSKVGSIAVNS